MILELGLPIEYRGLETRKHFVGRWNKVNKAWEKDKFTILWSTIIADSKYILFRVVVVQEGKVGT